MKTRWIYPILLLSSPLSALPHGEEVAAGNASFQGDEHSLVITASDKAILNFRSFDIGKEEMLQFIQPSKKAEVLARVVGSDSSQILGTLKANGRLFLVNPYGIYFGKDSIISTAGFVASALNIRDRDFLEGTYRFSKEQEGEIFNEGTLTAHEGGFVALLAPQIRNHGSIYAQAGKVILASGEQVVLDFSGDGLLRFSVDGELKESLIEQAGLIDAAQGTVALSMRSVRQVLQELVNTDGVEVAAAAEIVGGVVRLLPGTNITASKIAVEGDDRIFVKGAKLDASGETGGGEVFIGGGYQGKGDLRRSIFTAVDEHTTIFADAKTSGNEGTVVVWSDKATLFNGTIFARGGALSGNGGLVETSGKIKLGILETAHVNTLAPKGSAGDWLLDPAQININASGGTAVIGDVTTNCTSTNIYTINASAITASNSNLTLCAKSPDQSANIILINTSISMGQSGVGITFDVDHTPGFV